ncbi:MAG: DUF3592 domain-containing protein [Chloroflexi bacterium]|nr:DUF3592 domain-containing protein [Chloroflexota bacterium]MCI0577206.1 DUF3592 domain-containing protein [Chloroflexota bacterium]MCI0649084.1 DUF3592 domain-containing protein [Chloroflexota bacterium]MCI0729699.1 DUF3592 domain-containing protein [Chloroflexota bacterium]
MVQSKPQEQALVAVVFFSIGLCMLVVGVYLGWNSYQGLAGLDRTTATVTHVETIDAGEDVDYFPTVEFTTADGDFIRSTPATPRQTSALGGLVTINTSDNGYDTAYAASDEVEVFYNPDNPSEVVLNDFNKLWVAPLVVGGLGALFTFLGGLLGLFSLFRWWRR